MDKITIEISYQEDDSENTYSDGPVIAQAKVVIAPIPAELRGALTARIMADAHKTIVGQQVQGPLGDRLTDVLEKLADAAKDEAEKVGRERAGEKIDPAEAALIAHGHVRPETEPQKANGQHRDVDDPYTGEQTALLSESNIATLDPRAQT